jgi:hypothetical protein
MGCAALEIHAGFGGDVDEVARHDPRLTWRRLRLLRHSGKRS